MQIRIKKKNKDGLVRLESGGEVKEVRINEDFLNADNESISVCFRGENSSGIVDLTPKEIEMLYNSIKEKTHLIKDFKVIR
jgi:hypothetical protein